MNRRRGRRPLFTASGRRVILCPASVGKSARHPRKPEPTAVGLTWISGATLLLVLLFSVYAAGRPPVFPDDPRSHAPVSGFTRYTFADVLSSAGRRP